VFQGRVELRLECTAGCFFLVVVPLELLGPAVEASALFVLRPNHLVRKLIKPEPEVAQLVLALGQVGIEESLELVSHSGTFLEDTDSVPGLAQRGLQSALKSNG
jgi:hypothetical protein